MYLANETLVSMSCLHWKPCTIPLSAFPTQIICQSCELPTISKNKPEFLQGASPNTTSSHTHFSLHFSCLWWKFPSPALSHAYQLKLFSTASVLSLPSGMHCTLLQPVIRIIRFGQPMWALSMAISVPEPSNAAVMPALCWPIKAAHQQTRTIWLTMTSCN